MPKKNETFLERLIDKYGEEVVELGEDVKDITNIKVIRTGSTSLDVSLGVGGVPLGRITTVYGPESSAKTTLSLSIAKNAIEAGYNVLYVDVENALDFAYIKAVLGESFTHDRFILVQPEYAEDALTICENGINSGEFNLIILDSIGSLAPKKEKEDDFEKAHVAIVPRMLSAFLRRNAYSIRTKNIAFVFVNQVRAVIGSYVATESMPGGNALRHFSSVILALHKSEQIKFGDEIVGSYSRFTVKKNKLAPPFRSSRFPLIYGVGIDRARDTVEFAEMLSVLEKRGTFYYFEGDNIGQGLAKTSDYLSNNKEVLDKIAEKCYTINSAVAHAISVEESELQDE